MRAYAVRPVGGRWAAAAHSQRAGEGSTADMGAGHGEERTPNMAYMPLTLEVSKLSGWLNTDASCAENRKEGMRCGARCTGWHRREAAGDGVPSSVHRRGLDCWLGGRAWGGAHGEHGVHVRDAGGVEAQRLVER